VFGDLGLVAPANVDNEIHILRSKKLMNKVVEKLNLDISYYYKGKFRNTEYYKNSPVTVTFIGDVTAPTTFSITPFSENRYKIEDVMKRGEVYDFEKKALFNDTLVTPVGVIVVTPTTYLTKDKYNEKINVIKSTKQLTTMRYTGSVSVQLADKKSSVLTIKNKSNNPLRSEDLINTLIDVYNQDAIEDKNIIAENTSRFIEERLSIISMELGDVDKDIEDFKRENKLTDLPNDAQLYLNKGSRYQEEEVLIETQIALAKFIKSYINDSKKSEELIPSNMGISDAGIDNLINSYNTTLLQKDKLSEESNLKNPIVEDLNRSLSSMRVSIEKSVDNMLGSLELKLKEIQKESKSFNNLISAVPSQEKKIISIVRQQKIKEELYLFLLNKREENALSMAITESNARVVDAAYGSNGPVSPNP
jgi:uncharacterized protein involved in exopolysaccharide biosynthesis